MASGAVRHVAAATHRRIVTSPPLQCGVARCPRGRIHPPPPRKLDRQPSSAGPERLRRWRAVDGGEGARVVVRTGGVYSDTAAQRSARLLVCQLRRRTPSIARYGRRLPRRSDDVGADAGACGEAGASHPTPPRGPSSVRSRDMRRPSCAAHTPTRLAVPSPGCPSIALTVQHVAAPVRPYAAGTLRADRCHGSSELTRVRRRGTAGGVLLQRVQPAA
jgi:hypothetical protein